MRILSEQIAAETVVEGLTVRKSVLELGRENVAGIKLELSSDADHPVAVELVEQFPGHFSMSDVQVHPSYRPTLWTTDESRHRLVFEAELEPKSALVTIYGLRVSDVDLEAFLDEPQHVRVEPVDGGDEAGGMGELTRRGGPTASQPASVTADDREHDGSVTGPGRGSAAPGSGAADRPPGTTADEPPVDSPTAAEGQARPTGSGFQFGEDRRDRATERSSRTAVPDRGPSGAGEPRGSGDTGVGDRADLGALIEQLAHAELTDDQRSRLRAVTDRGPDGAAPSHPAGTEPSIAELSEMTHAFDQVVDAVGASAEAVVELGGAHEALADDVDRLSARAKAAAGDRDALRGRLDQLEEAVATLYENHDTDVDDLDARLAELEAVFVDEGEVNALRQVIAGERLWRERTDPARPRPSLSISSVASER